MASEILLNFMVPPPLVSMALVGWDFQSQDSQGMSDEEMKNEMQVKRLRESSLNLKTQFYGLIQESLWCVVND